MINKLYRKVLLILVPATVVLYSCTDKVLDVQPRASFPGTEVWSDPNTADLFLNDIYMLVIKTHMEYLRFSKNIQ